jgi:diacylglycerol kinase (ATP)
LDKSQLAITDQEISGVIAVGGDGTIQLGANICIPNQLPLGIVPAGSGNDISREIIIERGNIESAMKNILSSLENPRRVDPMRVATDDREFWSIRPISACFDALCTERANRFTWPKGSNSYMAALLLELPSFKIDHLSD